METKAQGAEQPSTPPPFDAIQEVLEAAADGESKAEQGAGKGTAMV